MNVLISAGEVSGDIVGAAIAVQLRRGGSPVRGVGGPRMIAAGVDVLTATNELGRVGVSESFSAILPFVRAFARIRRDVLRQRPDVAILIANDVFNAILGRWLRRQGVPVLAVYPPQVWIWRAVLGFASHSYDAVAASFPVEASLYARHVPTTFVGHHTADVLRPASAPERAAARAALGFGRDTRLVGLLPGSRPHEIRLLAPLLLDAAERLDASFVMAYAEESHRELLEREIALRKADVRLVPDSHAAMRASDLLLLASGTATLEAALLGTPMIALYRVAPLTILIVRAAIRLGLMDSETLALPNLLLGRPVIPEIKQESLNVHEVVREAAALLEDPQRLSAMRDDLAGVRPLIDGGGTIERIVKVTRMLGGGEALFPLLTPGQAGVPLLHGESA